MLMRMGMQSMSRASSLPTRSRIEFFTQHNLTTQII